MVKKAEQEVIDKRLEDTLDLFKPTARQEAAAEEAKTKAGQAPRKSRAYEVRPEHRVFGYRLGADLDQLLQEAVDEYRAEGWHTTKSDVIRAWALAGRGRWQAGEVEVEGKPVKAESRKRKLAPQADS
jgi:hypothetical protein